MKYEVHEINICGMTLFRATVFYFDLPLVEYVRWSERECHRLAGEWIDRNAGEVYG